MLLALVAALNADGGVDGILVQSPLPPAIGRGAAQQVFDAIDPAKDVDGFHPINVGRLVQGRARLAPCTPSGVIEMLDRSQIRIAGARAVVIGRSEIVGKPMAMLLLQRDATVTICHSKTPDLAALASTADILVAAIGRAGFVTPDFVKPGATVVDVGINRVTDAATVRALFRRGLPSNRRLRPAGVDRRRRRPSGRGGGRWRAHAGARRRRPADHRDAAEEHGGCRERAPRRRLSMVLAALTGGIATGKSYCLSRFAALGAQVIDADRLARDAVAPGTRGLAAVASRFGADILLTDGSLDRSALGRLVFADRTARADLEAIVHPEVYRRIREWSVNLPPTPPWPSQTFRSSSKPVITTISTRSSSAPAIRQSRSGA